MNNCFFAPCKTGAQVVGGARAQGRDMTKVSEVGADANGIEEFCGNPEFAHHCAAGRVRVLYVNESEALGPAMAALLREQAVGGRDLLHAGALARRGNDASVPPLSPRASVARRARALTPARFCASLSLSLSRSLARAARAPLEQVDAHLRFAPEWDAKYIAEARACKNYPKAVLSSYPPGFTGGAAR